MLRFGFIPLRNLRQRRLRSALTVLGVAAAVAGYVALSGLGDGVERAWVESLRGVGGDLLGYRKGSLEVLTGALPQGLAATMRNVEGVAEVAPELVDIVAMESGDTVVIRGWETESMLWRAGTVLAGRLPGPESDDEVLLGESLADALQTGPGEDVLPFGARLRVAGVARFPGAINNHSMVMPLTGMQALLDRHDQVTVVNVRVSRGDDENEVMRVRDRLNRQFTQLVFSEVEGVAQANEIYRLWRGMAWATSLVGLGMALVIVVNTMLVAVLERTPEIGLFVALGWSTRRIVALVFLEGLMLTLAGGILGLPFGAMALRFLSGLPRLRGLVVGTPSADVLAHSLFVVVVLGVAGALYPVWRAIHLDPVDALRDQ